MTWDQWHEVIDTNLFGVHHSTIAFLPLLLKNDHGCIVNIFSTVALHGAIGQANYAASKAGVSRIFSPLCIGIGKIFYTGQHRCAGLY